MHYIFKIVFWTWDYPLGYGMSYYDGFHEWINVGLFAFCWRS